MTSAPFTIPYILYIQFLEDHVTLLNTGDIKLLATKLQVATKFYVTKSRMNCTSILPTTVMGCLCGKFPKEY